MKTVFILEDENVGNFITLKINLPIGNFSEIQAASNLQGNYSNRPRTVFTSCKGTAQDLWTGVVTVSIKNLLTMLNLPSL